MSSAVTLIPYKALPNDDLEEDYSQKHIQLGVGQQVLGRGDFLSISDKRVSRSQATLSVEPEDDKNKITLKRLGMNAMFVVRNDGQWIPLEKEQEIQLEDGDCFSMCVREFMFRIKVEQSEPKPPSQPAATQEDSQLIAKKQDAAKSQPAELHKEVKQPAEAQEEEGWFTKKKKELKPKPMEVEHKEHAPERTKEINNNHNNKHQENVANETNSQDSDAKKNKRKITEEESDEEEYVEKVQKQIEKHQSSEDVSTKNKKQKTAAPPQQEVEDDEALARRLQKELEEEDKKEQQAKNNKKKTNKKKPVEDDEALAKRLQKELEQEDEEQVKKDAQLAKSLSKGHKSKGKNMTYKSGRPRRICTLKKTKYEDDQKWSSEESWDERDEDDAVSGSSGSEADDWNSERDSAPEDNASQSGSDGEYKASKKKKQKPMCQYGAACYRTNADHLKAFRHPKKK